MGVIRNMVYCVTSRPIYYIQYPLEAIYGFFDQNLELKQIVKNIV